MLYIARIWDARVLGPRAPEFYIPTEKAESVTDDHNSVVQGRQWGDREWAMAPKKDSWTF